MGSQVESAKLTTLPKKGNKINTCQLLMWNPRWRRLPQMNVARSGHSLVVLEQVSILTRFPCISSRQTSAMFLHCLIFHFLLKVVFAVGGDTDTTEWLDTEAGDENYPNEPSMFNT